MVPGAVEAQSDSLRPVQGDSIRPRPLQSIKVLGRADDLTGIASSASQGHIGAADLRLRPLMREGELLEGVPGLIVTQHSGDGKANQYFVRGFNLDHGTDFLTRLEGMPLNMPSHAHGQGYTDLSFLIPEFVDYIDYRLGVSHTDVGDFGSAGSASFSLVRRLDRPFSSVGAGEHGLARVAMGASTRVGAGELLAGGEIKSYDGPWVLDQEVRKLSGLARYSWDRGASRFSVLGMAYRNRWNATDQIPLRAVSSGQVGRFGHIDDSDGGRTQRYSLSGTWELSGAAGRQRAELFAIYSDLSLFSNFTYFLDEERGDQFNQQERRFVFGGSYRRTLPVRAFGTWHAITGGVQTRTDRISPVGLHRTTGRARLGTVREDAVTESGNGLFVEAESRWRPWFRTTIGARGDAYWFDVTSDRAANSGRTSAGLLSPKASLVFSPSSASEVYVSGGLGFHSNDARGTTITMDPVSGAPAERVDPLVRSRGGEIGLRANAGTWRSTLAVWALDLDSELLFIGDGGATEPTDGSRRQGVTWANFHRPIPRLSLDADVSLARARFTGVTAGEDHVPGALERVISGGATWDSPSGIFGALRLRHFGSYPLIEDNTVRATATTLLNASAGILFNEVRVELTVLNLLDRKANDIQYYYASRLPGEGVDGVQDIHFHPVEPRQLRLALRWGR
jgi:hypothetical protein